MEACGLLAPAEQFRHAEHCHNTVLRIAENWGEDGAFPACDQRCGLAGVKQLPLRPPLRSQRRPVCRAQPFVTLDPARRACSLFYRTIGAGLGAPALWE
jgi:hypothetical protein